MVPDGLPSVRELGDRRSTPSSRARPRCDVHPGALAGWRCEGCKKNLCPDCVVGSQAGTVQLVCCARCAGHVRQLMVSRAQALPFSTRVLSAWRYPFNKHGYLAVLGLGFTLWLFSHFGVGGVVGAVGIFWASMFAAIRQSASGVDEIDIPDFSELWSGLFLPALGGVLGTAVLWVPAVLWAIFGHGQGELVHDPVLWVIVLAGVLYAPMALLAAATNSGLGQMLNPVAMFTYIRRIGRDYLVAVAALVVLGIVGSFVITLAALVQAVPIPVLTGFIASCLMVLVPLMMCRVLGLLLYVRGFELGWGVFRDFQDPVLPHTEPRGVPRPKAGDEQTSTDGKSRRWAPVELDPETLPMLPVAEVSGTFRLPPEGLDPDALPPLEDVELSGSFRVPSAEGLDPDALPPLEQSETSGSFQLPPAKALDPDALPPLNPAEVSGSFRMANWELDPRWLPPLAPEVVSGSFRVPTAHALDASLLPPLPAAVGELTQPGFAPPGPTVTQTAITQPGLDPAPAITAAVAANQLREACELYASANLSELAVAPEVHLAVGQWAAGSGNFNLSVQALKAAATRVDSPIAPKALVLLARIFGERLGDLDVSERLYRHVVSRYPGTPAAHYAKGRLAARK